MSQPPSPWSVGSRLQKWTSPITSTAQNAWNSLPQGMKDTAKVVGAAAAGYIAAPVIGTAAAVGSVSVTAASLMPQRVKQLLLSGTNQITRVFDTAEEVSSQLMSTSNGAPVQEVEVPQLEEVERDDVELANEQPPSSTSLLSSIVNRADAVSHGVTSTFDSIFESTPVLIDTALSVVSGVKETFDRQVEEASPPPPPPQNPLQPSDLPLIQRPLIIGGKNLNKFTPDVTELSERTSSAITDTLRKTRNNQLQEDLPETIPEETDSDVDEEEQLEEALQSLSTHSEASDASNIVLPLPSDNPIQSSVVAVGPPGPMSLPIDRPGMNPLSLAIPPPHSSASNSAQSSPNSPALTLSQKTAKTDDQLKLFNENIHIYATLNILHEYVGEQKAPTGGVYREIMRELSESGNEKPSLWKVYMKHLGKDLTFFQKFKAALFYFFLYRLTGIIPTAAEEFTTNLINSFRNDLTKGTSIETLSRFVLDYTEKFLNVSIGAIETFQRDRRIHGSPDAAKKAALDEMIQGLFQKSIEEALPEIAEIVVREFFVPIDFFKKWKSGKGPVRWIGKVFSTLLDRPMNAIVRIILRKKVLPTVLGSLLQETQNSTPERILVVEKAIYETAIDQIDKVTQMVNDPKPREHLPRLRGVEKLPVVSELLVKYLKLVPFKTPEELAEQLKSTSTPTNVIEVIIKWFLEGGKGLIEKGIQRGVEDSARIGLGILHNRGQIEELFCKLLETANSIFTSQTKYEELVSTCQTKKDTLKSESKKFFKTVISHSIRKQIDPSFHHAAVQTQKSYSDVQEAIQDTFDSFEALADEMGRKIQAASVEPTDENSVLPEIDDFCDSMERFVNQTTLQAIPEHIRSQMSPALQEGLDRTLQPIREKALGLIHRVGQEKILQQKFSNYTNVSGSFHMIQELLNEINRLIEPPLDSKNIDQACDDIENLCVIVRDQIVPLIHRRLPALAADLAVFSQAAARQAATLKIAKQKVLSSEWLMKEGGAVDRLVRYHQRDRTLHGFNPVPTLAEVRVQLAQLNENEAELTALIEDMEKYVSHSKLGNWDPFKAHILSQIAPDLKDTAGPLLDALFKNLKRSQDFSEESFQGNGIRFIESFDPSRRLELEPLLNQIHDFLAENSIIKAKLRRYKDRIQAIHMIHEIHQTTAENGLKQSLEGLSKLSEEHKPKFDDGRAPTYQKLAANIRQIRREVAQLKTMAQNIKPEKHIDLQSFTTLAGGLGGLAGGTLLSMFIPWPIVAACSGAAGMFVSQMNPNNTPKPENLAQLESSNVKKTETALQGAAVGLVAGMIPGGTALVSAAAGANVGHHIPDIILQYGDTVVCPAVVTLLDNALEESRQPTNFKTIYLLGLHAFSTCYGGGKNGSSS
ncbi:MAG: hypothetical protein JSS32_03150 [Verrucomicrobia bacterium]|nr:hypothetical protein [Verrucomicrobiota bacterium]